MMTNWKQLNSVKRLAVIDEVGRLTTNLMEAFLQLTANALELKTAPEVERAISRVEGVLEFWAHVVHNMYAFGSMSCGVAPRAAWSKYVRCTKVAERQLKLMSKYKDKLVKLRRKIVHQNDKASRR